MSTLMGKSKQAYSINIGKDAQIVRIRVRFSVKTMNFNKKYKIANQNIQTISIASSLKRKLQFAEIASELGALRFPEVGRMTHFDSPWDGINLVNRLVKFVSLGGPSV